MEQELIEKINELCPEDQGIFIEPFGCDGITEPLIYMRWVTGGETGGGYIKKTTETIFQQTDNT